MSSISVPAVRSRPMAVTVAIVLSVLVIVANFATPALPSGSGDYTVPTFVIVVGVILAVIGIGAVIGLWMLRKWGMILTVVVSAINLLLAAPGIVAGPSTWIKIFSAVFVLASALIIVLVALPESRRAYS
jgi:uncharacterized membrane protein (DUF2068 family)